MTNAPPSPMPNSATPTGRPMASTDPNATIRMMMAKARPNSSADGCSNSAKRKPPSSTRSPSTSGTQLADLVADVGGAGEVDVLGQVDGGVTRSCPAASPCGRDLELAARRVRALHRGDVVDLGDLGEHLLHRRLHRGVVDPLLGLEDDLTRLRRAAAVVELGLDEREALGRLEALEREVLAVGVADAAGDAVADERAPRPSRRPPCGGRGTKFRGERTLGDLLRRVGEARARLLTGRASTDSSVLTPWEFRRL